MFALSAARHLLTAGRVGSARGLAKQQPAGATRRLAAAAAAAAAEPERRPGQRPSKTAAKQEAKQFQGLARQLARLNGKQLARLVPLVGEAVVDAAELAGRISIRNQGRQRQENLVARLLREASEVEGAAGLEPEQLQAAVDSVRTGQGTIANPAAEQQSQLWLESLLSGDSEATTVVFGLAQASGAADTQQLRQMVRQAQQTEAAQPEEGSGGGSDDSGGEATAALARGSHGPRPTAKAVAARRQLRRLLQQLAQAQMGGGSGDDDEA